MPNETKTRHVLIGTAGHIDHGKTRLVARLTGMDTDRLPEEKARGISIDLGFAHWESGPFRFGVVDMPGHERFVKNMVAGATGVNLALLVVAADDSVMPQTREHLEIMDLLGVKTGVIAITKTDLIDAEYVELVQAEIEETVAGTFLEGCPIVPVSSETGEGIEELRETLARVAGEVEWADPASYFRLPIDRVFSLTGHGTIVTGSVLSGEVHAGDMLNLMPDEREIRVRSVETHHSQAEESGARRRTAINVAGMKVDEIARGRELVAQGYLRPTRRMVVDLRSLSGSSVAMKDRLELNLHIGTAETSARVILKGHPLKQGERAFAELRLKEPIVASYGQRFILRRISPALTVAGGTILDPAVPPLKRIKDLQGYGKALATESAAERVSFLLSQQDVVSDSPTEAVWRVGVRPDDYIGLIEELQSQDQIVEVPSGDRQLLVQRDRFDAVSKSVMRTIREQLEKHQPRRALPRNTLLTACREISRSDLIEAVFARLLKTKELAKVGENFGPADAQVRLSKNQRAARDKILAETAAGGVMPPDVKNLMSTIGMKPDQINPLLTVCVEDGLLVRVSDLMYYTPEGLEQARVICCDLLSEKGEAPMSELRETWGVSRKYAVPLCEYFDSVGITVRQGDVRVAGPEIETVFA
jgi:selenocysteine-specific elongation factor